MFASIPELVVNEICKNTTECADQYICDKTIKKCSKIIVLYIVTPPQKSGVLIFLLWFICLCVCVCLSNFEQNVDRNAALILSRSTINSCLPYWLGPY